MFSSKPIALLDGGLSTALEALGSVLDTSLWSGELLRTSRNQIRAAHQSFVDAGAQILITSSYQITYPGCKAHGWSHDEVTDALKASTELARFGGVKVAASVGPYGAYLADGSEYRGNYGMSVAALKDFHRERLHVLLSTHPDYLAIETIPEITEAHAILELLMEFDAKVPFWISFSCKSESELSSGELFSDAADLVSNYPLALGVGINCTKPALIAPLMQSVTSPTNFVIYPNSGREWDAVAKEWIGDQASAFTHAQLDQWRSLGAVMIGGCCGVGPLDIGQMKELIAQ